VRGRLRGPACCAVARRGVGLAVEAVMGEAAYGSCRCPCFVACGNVMKIVNRDVFEEVGRGHGWAAGGWVTPSRAL